MARGRMISKSLSTSEKRARLHQEAGRLAEFCQALYPLLVAHSDDWGIQQGDVFTIKHLVDPTSPRRLADFEKALIHLHNVGLITWYEAEDGKRYVYVCGFSAHQDLKGHDKSRSGKNPPPPENPSKIAISPQIPPKSPNGDATKEKRTELNLTEPIQSPRNPGTVQGGDLDDRGTVNRDVHAFLKRFCELYTKYRHGARYLVRREKDVPLIRRMLGTYARDRLEKLAVVLLTSQDEWIAGTDRGVSILSVKASMLDSQLAAYEQEHGEIRIAS